MEYVQASSGAEGTRMEHDVPSCVLQHLVSDNKHMEHLYIHDES